MSGSPEHDADSRAETLARIRRDERFVLVAHENLDGDALGSLIAMHGLLRALGKDAVMFVADSELPLPREYRFIELEDRVQALPEDIDQRTVVFLDCGNIDRNPASVLRDGRRLLNIDHHHDNTRFGDVNYVVETASCTAEIIWDLMGELGVSPTPAMADAMYVALITDTGRFMYENTGPRAHEMAAALLRAGVDVQRIYRKLYEEVPFAKLALLARALESAQRFDGGQLTLAAVTAEDFSATGSEESYSEGVVDHLRAVAGTKVAALVRDKAPGQGGGERKVSLRATGDDVDVSIIARAQGGGGHRRAAGFSTTLKLDELIPFLRQEIAAQLGTPTNGQAAATFA